MFSTRIQTESRLQRYDWLKLPTTCVGIGHQLEVIETTITELGGKQLGKKILSECLQ